MLGFTILSVLWLAGLALGGQADPAKHGWIFDSMMNELDCYHVLDQFNGKSPCIASLYYKATYPLANYDCLT